MFTGIVEACTSVRRVEPRGEGIRLWIAAPVNAAGSEPWAVRGGESWAVSGACLSVAAACDPERRAPLPIGQPGADLGFDVSSETLARTWFADLEPGRVLNLERALRLGDRLDGHLVAGHVDGVARIVAIEDTHDGGRRMRFEVEPALARYFVDKGSVTLDGVSLTVVAPVGAHGGARFDVAVIPITLAQTSLGQARVGQRVNVEADMLGKWIDRLLAARG